MWKCAACGGNGAVLANASTTTAASSPAAPHLLLKYIPPSAMAPLFFFCSACSLRMASCESCHVLVDTEKAVGGVLLCRRCGVLTVLDPTLRALLAIPAFNRSFLNRVPFSIAAIVTLRDRILQCEAQLKSAKQHHDGSEPAESGSLVSSQQIPPSDSLRQRKRRRMVEATPPPDSQVSPPPSFRLVDTFPSQQLESPSSSQLGHVSASSSSIPALEAQSNALQRQLHDLVRQWEQFASETTVEQSTSLHHNLQQSFSSTHLNILKVMYDNTTTKLEVAALTRQIEQFLLHQSTLLKMKYDLLATVETCREIEQLRAPVFQKGETPSLKVTNLIINSTKEQLSHRYRAFQTLARPYLSLISAANKHLFALYSAAQSLQSMRETSEHERKAAMIQRELFGTNNSNSSKERADGVLSPYLSADHTRSRRRYGYSLKSSSSNNSSGSGGITTAALTSDHHRHLHLMAGGYDDVSRVQQTLEFGNRITEISKKVELWRALSATIASTCVLSVSELSLANDVPLS